MIRFDDGQVGLTHGRRIGVNFGPRRGPIINSLQLSEAARALSRFSWRLYLRAYFNPALRNSLRSRCCTGLFQSTGYLRLASSSEKCGLTRITSAASAI